jgi:hypothetical protein
MIITAGRGLRIARTFLPADEHLRQDLKAARGDFRSGELWAAFEWNRMDDLRQEKNLSLRKTLARSYAQVDRSKTRNSLANLRDVMTIFDSVEGTKNLLLFADTIRLIPGCQYSCLKASRLNDVHSELQDLAEAANERNVRIYPVRAEMRRADDALTMLASETGGRVFEGSNVVDGAFERVAGDIACFYRVGFRVRPSYSGKVEPIRVQVVNRRSTVRLRYRQTLEDPTRDEIEADMIRAAFMAPTMAHAFPIAVRVTELFRRQNGSRLQVEIGTPLGALLGLPAPTGRPGSRQVRVEIGARVVPLRPLPEGDSAAASRSGVWADVATDLSSSGFGRQAVLTLPPPSRPDRSLDRVVATAEFDAPPGRYRIVGVIQDQLARMVSAAVTDLQLDADTNRLGTIGLASGDAHAVLLRDTPAGDPEQQPLGRQATDPTGDEHIPPGGKPARDASGWKGKNVALAPALLPPGALLNETSVVEQGGPAHLYYSVCLEPSPKGRRARQANSSSPHPSPGSEPSSGRLSSGDGWQLERVLSCGSESTAVRLPPRSLAAPRKGVQCEPLIDSIPADALRPGRCRFDLLLKGPGGEQERGAREFTVVPPTARDATVTGSFDASHTGSSRVPHVPPAGGPAP